MPEMFEIRNEREHYEIYIDGVFYCSADTYPEAVNEIKAYIEKL